jgi:hypothetical protein
MELGGTRTPDLLGAMHLRRLRAGRRWWPIRSAARYSLCSATARSCRLDPVCPWCARGGLDRIPGGVGLPCPSAKAPGGVNKERASAERSGPESSRLDAGGLPELAGVDRRRLAAHRRRSCRSFSHAGAQGARMSRRCRAIGHAPVVVFDSTVYVSCVAGSCRLWKETPASEPSSSAASVVGCSRMPRP